MTEADEQMQKRGGAHWQTNEEISASNYKTLFFPS